MRHFKIFLDPAVGEENSARGNGHNAEATATDTAGIEEVNAVLIDLAGLVGMAEEDDRCRLLACESEKSAHTVLCAVEVTVSEDYAVSLEVYSICFDRVSASEAAIEVAVACYGEPGAGAITRGHSIGVVEAVTEEEHDLGVGIARESLAHIAAVAVRIRKYKTFHNKNSHVVCGCL